MISEFRKIKTQKTSACCQHLFFFWCAVVPGLVELAGGSSYISLALARTGPVCVFSRRQAMQGHGTGPGLNRFGVRALGGRQWYFTSCWSQPFSDGFPVCTTLGLMVAMFNFKANTITYSYSVSTDYISAS